MNMKTPIRRMGFLLSAALFAAGMLLGPPALAQESSQRGVVRGRVTDAAGVPIVGAAISVTGTAMNTITDSRGEYYLANVPVGPIELVASSVGYDESTTRLSVGTGAPAQHDFRLGTDVVQLGAFVVEGTREGQARALTQQKNANNLMTVVSADAVGKFPDAYVGDALRRLVGIVVEEDQGEATGVTIRGIEPDFNNITINGMEVASAGTPGAGVSNQASRPVGLDIFSVDLIESIEVAKATTPDMDGNGLGGAVNVKTKTAFSRGGREFSASGEYTYADLNEGREGYRATATYSDVFGANKQFGALFSVTKEERDRRVERVIPQSYDSAGLIRRARANGYNQTLDRTSYMASFDYKLSEDTLISFKPTYAEYDDASDYDRAQIHADQRRYQNEYVKDHREKSLYTLDLSTETKWGSNRLKFGGLYSFSDEVKPENQKHIFRTGNNRINVTFNQDDPIKPYPVLSSFSAGDGVPSTEDEKALFTLDEAKFRGNRQEETRKTAFVDYSRDVTFMSRPTKLKLGAKYTTTSKFDDAWSYVFGGGDTTLDYNSFPTLPSTRIQDNWHVFVLDKRYMLDLFNGPDRDDLFEYDVEGSISDSIEEDFSATEDLFAFYASAVMDFRKLRLEGGVRYENLSGEYTNYGYDEDAYDDLPGSAPFPGYDVDPASVYPDTVKIVEGSGSFSNFLPSIHARYQPSDNWVIRSAISTNVGRPKFTDLTGLASFRASVDDDGSSYRLVTGNPDLKAAESVNYDLTFSYFGLRPLGLLEFGAFYKTIDGRVFKEVTLREATAEDVALYGTASNGFAVGDIMQVVRRGNADSTKIFGAEIDWRMELTFLPGFLGGLGLGGNFTYADSEEIIPPIQTLPLDHPDQPARVGEKVSYPRQPKHSGNYYISFNRWGLDARYTANYTGKNLRSWSDSNPLDDQYNMSRWRYDVIVNYAFARRWVLTASVINLTDEPLVTYAGLPNFVRNSEFQGRTARVGLRYFFR